MTTSHPFSPIVPDFTLDAEGWQRVADNAGLVWAAIRRMSVRPEHEDDAYGAGILGLGYAVAHHDPAKGTLGTYGTRWIRNAIARDREAFEGSGFRRHGRPAVRSGLGQPIGTWRAPLSIDKPLGTDEDVTLADTLATYDDFSARCDTWTADTVAALQRAKDRLRIDPRGRVRQPKYLATAEAILDTVLVTGDLSNAAFETAGELVGVSSRAGARWRVEILAALRAEVSAGV